MSRRQERAAQAASEAGRVLQQQRQQAGEREAQALTDSHDAVDPKPEGETPPPRNEPRRLAMEEIEKRHEHTEGYEPPKAEETPEVKTEQTDATPPASSSPAPSQEDAVPAVVAPKSVKVKIDGEESDVLETEVEEYGGIKPYQIAKATEKRLKASNEALAENRRTQAQLVQWVQQQLQPKQPQQTPDELIQSKIDVIRFGSPEESAAALREVMEKSTTRIDPNEIERRMMIKVEQREGIKAFSTEFSDVFSNPLMMKLATTLEAERLQQLQAPPDWPVFYRQIGNELRSVMGPQHQQTKDAKTTDPTSQVSSDKEERKSSIVNLPTAASRAELPKEPKPETHADILNEMRRSRGLQTG